MTTESSILIAVHNH